VIRGRRHDCVHGRDAFAFGAETECGRVPRDTFGNWTNEAQPQDMIRLMITSMIAGQ